MRDKILWVVTGILFVVVVGVVVKYDAPKTLKLRCVEDGCVGIVIAPDVARAEKAPTFKYLKESSDLEVDYCFRERGERACPSLLFDRDGVDERGMSRPLALNVKGIVFQDEGGREIGGIAVWPPPQ